MQITYSQRFIPEMECIYLLERHFQDPANGPTSIPEIRDSLSAKYNIPIFELDPLLQPLADVEHYVLTNLNVSEEKLRLLFSARGRGLTSLAQALYHPLQNHIRYNSLPERARIAALKPIIARTLDLDGDALDSVEDLDSLMHYLLQENAGEDVKWVCAALYYAADTYLEELDITLRKATALFLEHLPDSTALCAQAMAAARQQIVPDPSRLFVNFHLDQEPEHITVLPSLMAFHGLQWFFPENQLYYGVYYGKITELVSRYADQSASLVRRLKAMGDNSRLEILRVLREGPCNGQDIAEKLSLAPATISHHMSLLCTEGLLDTTRRGTSIYYELNPGNLQRFLRELEHYLL